MTPEKSAARLSQPVVVAADAAATVAAAAATAMALASGWGKPGGSTGRASARGSGRGHATGGGGSAVSAYVRFLWASCAGRAALRAAMQPADPMVEHRDLSWRLLSHLGAGVTAGTAAGTAIEDAWLLAAMVITPPWRSPVPWIDHVSILPQAMSVLEDALLATRARGTEA